MYLKTNKIHFQKKSLLDLKNTKKQATAKKFNFITLF